MNNPWLEPLIRAARKGDDAAARGLVRYLAICLESGAIPPDLVGYFTPIFRAIGGGRSADKELKLSTQSHIARDFDIALAVWELNHRTIDRMPLRYSEKAKTGAYRNVAEQYAMDEENVERIYKKMKRLVGAGMAETSEPGEDREGLEVPKEIHDRLQVNMQIAFAQLTDSRKK